ncbi:DNA-directed DNA polymerase [Chloroherpeton thalassium ATCC 35110]|uniref:DNA-directed DNA polymerase n=1 Tax=Chloroherpeton thalassium (strain ATCC 35110 / GB-78) TaxID=517418 RepID=B3QU04_CHLT3|nr:DNA polymerase III subunit [Chloroherpeton thalassium]ACF12802.1 DNA-directed DNA polymerase [Chloroherpeton thalassium ATCC 35110]
MAWERINGQERQISVLRRAIKTNRLPNAFLFTGPEGVGKEAVAIELAKVLNCDSPNALLTAEACEKCESCKKISALKHPNLEFIFPVEKILLEKTSETGADRAKQEDALERMKALLEEKRRNPYHSLRMDKAMGILKDQILLLQEKAAYKPLAGKKRVFILSQAESMNEASANKLLKLLEEPPPYVLFILVSSQPEMLLPTIVSRCQPLRFSKLRPEEIREFLERQSFSLEADAERFIASFSRGNLNHVVQMAFQSVENREKPELQRTRDEALQLLRMLLSRDRGHEVIRQVEQFSKRDKTRDEQRQILLAMLRIFQDVVRKQNAPNETGLVNADIETAISKFAQNFPDADFESAVKETESAIYKIGRNANPFLTFSALCIKLKTFLTR